ncbi:MAG: hypothetical protein ABF308_20150 [Phaeobacter gallaeciensis]
MAGKLSPQDKKEAARKKAAAQALRKYMSQAKMQDLNFAFCPGKSEEGAFLADRIRPVDALVRDARKESEGTQTVSGRMSVDGSNLRLTCDSTLPNLEQRLKLFLSAHGIQMRIHIETAKDAPPPPPPDKGDSGETGAGEKTRPPAAEPADAPAAAPGAKGPDSARMAQLRKSWDGARQAALGDMKTLIGAIAQATRGLPGLDDAPRRASALAGHFKPFDARMGKALKALEAQPGDERLHKAVAGLVQEYRKLLDTEFFRAVDDNGFAKTGIRSALIRPLDQINQALAS